MADIVLYTQFVEQDGRSSKTVSACLLVYDQPFFSDERLSNDLREQLETRPTLTRAYVVAPTVKSDEMLLAVQDGSARVRVSEWATEEGSFLRLITAERPLVDGPVELFESFLESDASGTETYRKRNLVDELRHGWLFDLFVRGQGMVYAPPGVHFGKTSGKHSDRFLRTSNVLSSSSVCRLLAFFCLPLIPLRKVRQIYVDTLPLVGIGLSILEVGEPLGLVVSMRKVESFGSYQGVRDDHEYLPTDLILVSASTSGGLAQGLLDRGAERSNVITLFYLQAKGWGATIGSVLCDLTHRPARLFGYAEVLSYQHSGCPLCESGSMLAEFEGDQFLLQRRRTKRLKIVRASQPKSARDFFELASRKCVFSVSLVGPGRSKYSDLSVDVGKLLASTDEVRAEMTFKLRRSAPTPLDFIVTDDAAVEDICMWTEQNGKRTVSSNTPRIDSAALEAATPAYEAGVLVYFGMLHNDFRARSVNRALRRAAPRGSITYFVTVLMSESPEARRDLLSFLSYGERGPATFVVEPVCEFLLSQRDERSPWDLERDLLAQIVQEEQSAPELQRRLGWLGATASASTDLFLDGQTGPLGINDDFVYLDTKRDRGLISHADVYAVTCNLLAACRNDNRELSKPVARGNEAVVWESSVYGQVLLCPRNFKDYNDGVLHASLLRGASSRELRYDTDEALSSEMLEIMLDELRAWSRNGGQALAEFCLAMRTGRLILKQPHEEEFKSTLASSPYVPRWVKLLGGG